MNQAAEVIVLATGMRQVRADLTIAKRAAQSDKPTQHPGEKNVAAASAILRHESCCGECAGADHVGDNGHGCGGQCQNASIRHESNRGKMMSKLVLFGQEILLSIVRGRDFNSDALHYRYTCI